MKKKHKLKPIAFSRWQQFPFTALCEDVLKRVSAIQSLIGHTDPAFVGPDNIRILEEALTDAVSLLARFCEHIQFHEIQGQDYISFDFSPGPLKIIQSRDEGTEVKSPDSNLN